MKYLFACIFLEIQSITDKNSRRLLLLHKRCTRRETGPRRTLCAHGIVNGQSYQVNTLPNELRSILYYTDAVFRGLRSHSRMI